MNATLYYNKSDKRVINKDLEFKKQFTVKVIKPSSIINPTLILTPEAQSVECNYLYLDDAFHRYYYIEEQIVENGRITLKCKVDVLMSHRAQFMELPTILEKAGTKNSKYWNMYLNDDDVKMYNYTLEETHPLGLIEGSGFDKDIDTILLALTGSVTGA